MACSYGSQRKGSIASGSTSLNLVNGMPEPARTLYLKLNLPLTYEVDIDALCASEPAKPAEWSPLDYVNSAFFIWKAKEWAAYKAWSDNCECNAPPPPPPPDPQPPSGGGSDPLTEGSFPPPYSGGGECAVAFAQFYDEWKQDFISQLAAFSAKAAEVALAGGTLDFVTRYQRTNPDGSPADKVVTDSQSSGLCECKSEARDWYLYLYRSSVPLEEREIIIEFPHSFNWVPLCRPEANQTTDPNGSPDPEPPTDPCSCGGFAAILAAIAALGVALATALATQTGVITGDITTATATIQTALTALKAALSGDIKGAKDEILDALKDVTGGGKPPIAVLVNIQNAPQDSITYGTGNAPNLQKLGWYFWSINKDGLTYYSERVFLLTRRTVLVAPSSDSRWVATFHFIDGITAQIVPFELK